MNITLALRTTRFLEREHEYMPWQTARSNLRHLLLMFDRSEVFGPIQVRQSLLSGGIAQTSSSRFRHTILEPALPQGIALTPGTVYLELLEELLCCLLTCVCSSSRPT